MIVLAGTIAACGDPSHQDVFPGMDDASPAAGDTQAGGTAPAPPASEGDHPAAGAESGNGDGDTSPTEPEGLGDPPQPGPHPRNPLGRVPILLYHRIGEAEGRWQRTPEGLYADLEQLYQAGFRPIRLRDYLEGRIDLPPGYAPVILTFDDSTRDQLDWDEPGVPSAASAVGVILRFAAEHPDWDATAVFFVNGDAFRSDSETKAAWLVEHGFEVENHTWSHADLGALDDTAAAREVGRMSAWIEAVTGQRPVAVALPFGKRPRHVEAVLEGRYEDHQFGHSALLEVGSGPARSPLDPDWNPLRLPRIQVADPGQVSAADLPGIWATWFDRLLESGDLFAN